MKEQVYEYLRTIPQGKVVTYGQVAEYLGNKIVCHSIPIRPGRNLSIICEAAAVNHRQKKMGYNAAEALATQHDFAVDAGLI